MLPAVHAWRLLRPVIPLLALAGCSLLVEQNLDDKPGEDLFPGDPGGSTTGPSGDCAGSCAPGTCCGGTCVDLSSDEAHCGACNSPCPAGRSCEDGACGPGWAAMSPSALAPSPREGAAAAWIGSGMFVWGGFDNAVDRADGAIYDPTLDTWKPVSDVAAPSARALAAAVWTGKYAVVFGGGPTGSDDALSSGGRYDPTSNAWLSMAEPSPPVGRRLPIAVWTGSHVIVWGGEAKGAPVAGGGRFDPDKNAWLDISKMGAPSARRGAAWAWTGSRLLLFGGEIDGMGSTSEGFAYDPAANKWSAMSSMGAPSPRYDAFAVWMGDASGTGELLVWGGRNNNNGELDSGARYNPATDAWEPVAPQGAPSERSAPAGRTGVAGWTGLRALLAGGLDNGDIERNGGAFDPAQDAWPAPIPPWPSDADHERGVGLWTGRELILWSGRHGGALVDSGERFMP